MDTKSNGSSGLAPTNFVATTGDLYFTGNGASMWGLTT
jgi:hypothetical protein